MDQTLIDEMTMKGTVSQRTLKARCGRTGLALLAFALTIIMPSCCKVNDTIGSVAVTLRPQETNNWCWAATTQMITETLGHGCVQCNLANQRFNRNDCCQGNCPKNSACNMPGWTMFTECGFKIDESNSALSWQALKEQIYCTKKPMAYAYGPKSGGVGHVLVVSGYANINGVAYVALTDAWAPCTGANRFITYTEYSNSGTTNHWSTMYNITYNQ